MIQSEMIMIIIKKNILDDEVCARWIIFGKCVDCSKRINIDVML